MLGIASLCLLVVMRVGGHEANGISLTQEQIVTFGQPISTSLTTTSFEGDMNMLSMARIPLAALFFQRASQCRVHHRRHRPSTLNQVQFNVVPGSATVDKIGSL